MNENIEKKHSPTPWAIHPHDPTLIIIPDNPPYEIAECCSNGLTDLDIANAARIVPCVNFCEQVPTEELIAGGKSVEPKLKSLKLKLASLRAELTAAQTRISNLTQLNELKTEMLGEAQREKDLLNNAGEFAALCFHASEKERDRYKAAWELLREYSEAIRALMIVAEFKKHSDFEIRLNAVLVEIHANENLNSGKEV